MYVTVDKESYVNEHQIMSYCLSELASKFHIENKTFFSNFTFAQLSKQHITSEHLYRWSAPIDIIEQYQFYLNQLSTSNDLFLPQQVYYNCTLPRFGPLCQYEFIYYVSDHASLYQIIADFYSTYSYDATNFTCYTHLECNRRSLPSCLDWTEICNGEINCLDGGQDEEHCWQLEVNDCQDDEYRCHNGQCIPYSFYSYDDNTFPDCVDQSDMRFRHYVRISTCKNYEPPLFSCDDMSCQERNLTHSCMENRNDLLIKMMYSNIDNSASKNCSSAFKCLLNFPSSEYLSCDKLCANVTYIKIIQEICPEMIYFPNIPVLFGNTYFAYKKTDLQYSTNFSIAPLYICYDTSQHHDFIINVSKILFNNMTCINSKPFLSPSSILSYPLNSWNVWVKIYDLGRLFKRYHLAFNYTSAICSRSNMYQCAHSFKCISLYHFMDNRPDCPHQDDENMAAISNIDQNKIFLKTHIKCELSGKYIRPSTIFDNSCDCGFIEQLWCEDEHLHVDNIKKNIIYQYICDGFIDLPPKLTPGQDETDETGCERWQCNNIYTHCNGVWNCPNGADEIGCVSDSLLSCPSEHHPCVSPNTYQLMCLPIAKTHDGNVDCLGATDEPQLCNYNYQYKYLTNIDRPSFYCTNQSSGLCILNRLLCNGHNDCEHGDDEQFCTYQTSPANINICVQSDSKNRSIVESFLCNYRTPRRFWPTLYFILDGIAETINVRGKNNENLLSSSSSNIEKSNQHQPRCHRGLDLRVWLNDEKNLTNYTCLCPPSYYGEQCQYQNQRIIFTIKFRALASSWRTLFAIIISLIDDSNEKTIHSYEQLTYVPVNHCQTKFHIYLVYSTRPKSQTKNYSIHIDIYEKTSLQYRGSLLFPVLFPFLPIHRLAFLADIPRSNGKTQFCSNDRCVHGKCIKYFKNRENRTFCQCDHGWSGQDCDIQHICTCALNSLCIGISANNQSICVCPLNKFGSRCLLDDIVCQTNDNSTCQNGGQCIPSDHYSVSRRKFLCLCPKGFNGDRCEIADTKIILSFGNAFPVSQSIYIHFIEIIPKPRTQYIENVRRATSFRSIPVREDSVVIYWTQPFHLVFIELPKQNYYLAIIQKTYNRSAKSFRTLNPSDHCPNISAVFNESFFQWPFLRRVKYYHLPCQNQLLNLSCFHDDIHFCLCYDFEQQRLANCFHFEHNMKWDCSDQNECEHGVQCFQDQPDCPTKSLCICHPCSFGILCQFNTNRFRLSLDAILGYHILPNVSLIYQPSIVKFSLSLTIVFLTAGFINGFVSIMTFKNKIVRDVGCGLYLLGTSIITLLTMVIFGLKFVILLLAQMGIISNRSFLLFQCHSIDFILKVCLFLDQWLNACVSFERAMTVKKGVSFVKKKSKQTAKLLIIILLIIIPATCIHDPIYRSLVDEENNDNDQKRIWCALKYPSDLEVFDYIIHVFHLFGPFIINIISSVGLIIHQSRQQANLHKKQSYSVILREQFKQHKHLLIAPVLLVILAIPRVILVFVSKCMESANDAWLFLVGYFISFIPAMSTAFIFILPSEFYRKQLRKSLVPCRALISK